MKQMQLRGCALIIAALAVLSIAPEARAQVQGTLVLKGGPRSGLLRWQSSNKSYVLTDKGMDVTILPSDVVKLSVVRPKELDPAIKAVRENKGADAIATLAKLATDYFMLQHDEEATRWLAEAYLQANNGADAIRAIEKITAVRPEAAYLGDLATVYWRALLRENRTSKLDDLLVMAVKSGNRLASATALLLRGDLILKDGDTQDVHIRALKDGYLRVVTLYRTVKEIQPEANYKAAKSLEKLGMTARAQERRETIRKDFPGSEWAGKP
jgi:hypothetical protein